MPNQSPAESSPFRITFENSYSKVFTDELFVRLFAIYLLVRLVQEKFPRLIKLFLLTQERLHGERKWPRCMDSTRKLSYSGVHELIFDKSTVWFSRLMLFSGWFTNMLNLEIFSVSWFPFHWHISIEGDSPARGGRVNKWRTGDQTVCRWTPSNKKSRK